MSSKQNRKSTDLITLADVTDAQVASMDRAECRAYAKKGVVPERLLQTRPVLVQEVCRRCGPRDHPDLTDPSRCLHRPGGGIFDCPMPGSRPPRHPWALGPPLPAKIDLSLPGKLLRLSWIDPHPPSFSSAAVAAK